MLDSLPIIRNDRGPHHLRTYEAIQRIVNLYQARVDAEKAEEFGQKLREHAPLHEDSR